MSGDGPRDIGTMTNLEVDWNIDQGADIDQNTDQHAAHDDGAPEEPFGATAVLWVGWGVRSLRCRRVRLR